MTVISISAMLADRRRRGVPDPAPESAMDFDDPLPVAVALSELPPPEAIPYAIRDFLVAGELAMFGGAGGALKTTAALALGVAKASGLPAFGRFDCEAGAVLIVSAEDGQGILVNHMNALVAGAGMDPAQVSPRLHLLATSAVDLTSQTWQDHLTAEVARVRPALIVFDPLAELLGGVNENDATELRTVIQFLRQLAATSGAAVLVLHHLNKPREGQGAVDRVRGSTSINAAMRAIYQFEAGTTGCRVTCTKLSRTVRPAPFSLALTVTVDPESAATWRTATLLYDRTRTVEAATAADHILSLLRSSGERLNTATLRGRRGSFRPHDVSTAIQTLHALGRINFVPGARGSRLWGVSEEQITVPF